MWHCLFKDGPAYLGDVPSLKDLVLMWHCLFKDGPAYLGDVPGLKDFSPYVSL
jgi:hypothetical protein